MYNTIKVINVQIYIFKNNLFFFKNKYIKIIKSNKKTKSTKTDVKKDEI
jgi:hypothetical protein